MNVTRFEDLTCWQKARALANAVYAALDLPEEFCNHSHDC
jgi:hypothetical protein